MLNRPPLSTHTHCQVAQKANRTSQNLSKSMAAQTHGRKESTGIQHCIKAIAGEVVNSRSIHLLNFCGGGQEIAFKSATALILDRYEQLYKNYSGSNDGLNTQCDNEKSGNMLKRHFKQK